MIDKNIKALLLNLADKYEDMEYFKGDPIIFPKQYTITQDIEISGLLSSVLSFGSRRQIVKKCKELDDTMEHFPYRFINNGKYHIWKDNNKSFYRFIKYSDLYDICGMLEAIYNQFFTITEIFCIFAARNNNEDNYYIDFYVV